MNQKRIDEIAGVVFIALGIFILGSLFSYHPEDVLFYSSSPNIHVKNWMGIIGAFSSSSLFFLLGYSSFMAPIIFLLWALEKFSDTFRQKKLWLRLLSSFLFLSSTATLITLFFHIDASIERFNAGGIIGTYFCNYMTAYLGTIGTAVVCITFIILSCILSTNVTFIMQFLSIFPRFAVLVKNSLLNFWDYIGERRALYQEEQELRKEQAVVSIKKNRQGDDKIQKRFNFSRSKKREEEEEYEYEYEDEEEEEEETEFPTKSRIKPKITLNAEVLKKKGFKKVNASSPGDEHTSSLMLAASKGNKKYNFPTYDLLNTPPPFEEEDIREELEECSHILEETLAEFDIPVKVVQIHQGPTITTYELEPAPGVKVNKIVNLADDISLALKAQSIRIVAPIPGKSCVGVEIPNSSASSVFLRDIFETKYYHNVKNSYKLPIILGKDVHGIPLVADIADMPHLLIAGATGAGKTVCVNTIISSLLCKMHPDMLKFIMVDPKMVEMTMYNDLPHLLCPVITDAKKVSTALNWIVTEMEQRYKLLAKVGVRNISGYNEKIVTLNKENSSDSTDEDEENYEIMPYIVVLIDELADLMMIARDVVESAIMRLAQLSRAVGIHLVLATQRPSVDVITGVIKANFPARIAFRVSSKVDSRTVLDSNGADKLLGKGDLLFLKPGAPKPIRAQGAFLADEEIERVVKFIKNQRGPQYIEEITEEKQNSMFGNAAHTDELFDEACKLVIDVNQASASLLQRRFRVGYTRAARLVDMMEEKGIVGPYRGSKPREILVESLDEPSI